MIQWMMRWGEHWCQMRWDDEDDDIHGHGLYGYDEDDDIHGHGSSGMYIHRC